MLLEDAIAHFENCGFRADGECGEEAWQTLKAAVSEQTAHNSDYAAALRVSAIFQSEGYRMSVFDEWCAERLNSAKAPNCA